MIILNDIYELIRKSLIIKEAFNNGIYSNNKVMKYYQPKSNYDLYLYEEESSTEKECKNNNMCKKIPPYWSPSKEGYIFMSRFLK